MRSMTDEGRRDVNGVFTGPLRKRLTEALHCLPACCGQSSKQDL